ncbi:microtubule-associated tumor suppressor 1 homolog A isoform X1 [Oncorhynchus kisutch]|uniref:Microtubule-associated tumor suppressor 1 homolog A-like n=1 Tax=Oncorhynchus kisutch TaxID=8019 RepID=A0A8C7F642_ONCKI|nr:microtubule-associated tumor suppressor 1-like isoform X1 [Oncorhynchus kisutch]XP_031645661.1 microtubule-associated tumor suppressor 1-like isoform X1 [Oncorhynchus kisutch]XP_031645662.1 microtubule-associated tumor suppressor 1-like isoform X1 [Oncorhynchus kisutch]
MSSVKTKCRPTQQALSSGPGDSNGTSVACLGTPSLDSLRTLSDRDSSIAPDMECCLIEGSPANHHTDHLNCTCTANTPINGNLELGSPPENNSLDLITFPENSTCTVLSPAVAVPGEGDILEPVQTSVSSCVNTSLDNWNGNITLVITSLQGHHGDNQGDWGSTTSSGDRSVAASSELASPEGEESSSSVSLRGSSENNCSIGSGEVAMRWNSFCLEEADTLTVSLSLVELSTSSSAHGSPALSADLGHGLLSLSTTTTLPDVCDGLLENRPTDTLKVKDNPGPQCWGMTFIQSDDQDLPPEGDGLAPPRSPVDVDPCEAEGVHQATFLCEPTPSAACGGASPAPSRRVSSDAYISGGSTEGRTFMLPASEELDLDGRAQTSTPVQCAGNKPLDLPSLTESPCTGEQSHIGSPVVQTAIDQRGAAPMLASPKHCLVASLPPSSANRISKAEIKKFPKPDFSRVRPKIMSRPAHPLTLGSPAPAKNKPGKPVNQPCRKPSQVNRNTPMRNTPVKLATVEDGRPRAAVAENAVPDFHGMTFIQADDQDLSSAAGSHIGPLALSLTEEADCRSSLCDSVSAAFENVPPVAVSSQATSRVSSEAEHVSSNCGGGSAPVLPGNQTCFPSPTESPSAEQRADPAPALASPGKAGNKEEVPQRKRPGSVSSASSPSNQAPVSARRSRCWSESSSTTSIPHRESRASPSGSASFIIPKAYVHLGQSQARPASHNPTGSAHNKPPETRKEAEERSSKEIKKSCLVTASSKTASKTAMGATAAVGAACDRFKSRLGARPSLNRARGAPASAPQALPPVSRQRQGRDVCSSASSGMCSPRAKQSTTAGHQRSQTNEGVPVGTSSASGSTKPPVTGSRLPQASGHTLAVGSSQPSTAVSSSRLPYKSHGVPKSIPSKASVHNEHSGSTGNAQVSAGAAHVSVGRPASCKTPVLKARLLSHPGSNIGPAGCKTTESTNRVPSRSRASPMKRTASSRLLRPAAVLPVDKNRPRATPRSHPQPQQQSPAPLPPQRDGHPDLLLAEGRAGGMESYRAPCERKNQSLHQLQGLLAASNCKFEAIVVVLQQTLAEHDEVIKQRRDLSQELMTLKVELVNSARSCELLEREKDEVCGALEGVLQTMQEQHHTELAQLEERLRVFYQAEWDKIHLTYQEEADRCKALMEQQMTELRASHEAVTLELEASNSEQIQVVKQQYEESLKEFHQAHERELQTLDTKLKEAEATLSGQIQELIEENTTLNHRIKAEEDQRRELAERSQKDSHTLYLEQELESLKVVLDIKNKQLHQQDHKLMQMAKMTEKSVKLDECLKKVQQENEDLKARMDRHAALSRQLSTEQAVLQESLHKESKVNKRLSMENEELIWKLHNGDPSSPHKLSPTSPSHHSLGLQSPRSSAVFTSPIQSPRSSAVFSSPPVSPR